MRFKIVFQTKGDHNILPINYQYELASWIYKVLDRGDTEFAGWLHDHGYKTGKQFFKFFTFSHLDIPKQQRRISGDRIFLKPGEVSLIISFLPEQSSENFIKGLFRDLGVTISDRKTSAEFLVKQIERLPDPLFAEKMEFRLISPMVISAPVKTKGKIMQKYLSPGDAEFGFYFKQNLLRKLEARMDDSDNKNTNLPGNSKIDTNLAEQIKINILSDPRKKGITLKSNTAHPIKVIGYLFEFELSATDEIISTGYYGGFGDMCSQGFGCGEVRD